MLESMLGLNVIVFLNILSFVFLDCGIFKIWFLDYLYQKYYSSMKCKFFDFFLNVIIRFLGLEGSLKFGLLIYFLGDFYVFDGKQGFCCYSCQLFILGMFQMFLFYLLWGFGYWVVLEIGDKLVVFFIVLLQEE